MSEERFAARTEIDAAQVATQAKGTAQIAEILNEIAYYHMPKQTDSFEHSDYYQVQFARSIMLYLNEKGKELVRAMTKADDPAHD